MFPLWNFFLEKKEFTTVLIVAFVVAGVYSANATPKEASPAINIPVGSVTTTFPGASAEDVETLVTNPLEEQIVNIGDIDTLTSTSIDGGHRYAYSSMRMPTSINQSRIFGMLFQKRLRNCRAKPTCRR